MLAEILSDRGLVEAGFFLNVPNGRMWSSVNGEVVLYHGRKMNDVVVCVPLVDGLTRGSSSLRTAASSLDRHRI